jgi:predicted AAA+ superfamily ATPase
MDQADGARYLAAAIADDALPSGKMAFISGPRQVGKTTLAMCFLRVPQNSLTSDDASFRRA